MRTAILLFLLSPPLVAAQAIEEAPGGPPLDAGSRGDASDTSAAVRDGRPWARRPLGDGGAWRPFGPPNCVVTNFDAVPTANGLRLLTACERHAVYGAFLNGRQWHMLGAPPGETKRVGATANGTLFADSGPGPDSGVHRSLDGGRTWEEEVLDFRADAFLRAPGGAFYVFASSSFADVWYRTTDEGETWTTGGIPGDHQAVAVLPSGRLVLTVEGVFDGVGRHMVVLSDDGGLAWREAAAPPNPHYDAKITAFAVGDDGVIYGVGYRVWRSTDGGEHWEMVRDEYPGSRPPIAAGPPGTVVVADEREVLYSLDWGETWASAVLPVQEPEDLEVTALYVRDGRRVLAGTSGRGVYVGELPHPNPTSLEDGPPASSALAVWPNPASTALTVSVPPGTTAVEVLDMLGRVVLSVPVGGTGRVEVGVASLPRGVYVVRADGEAAVVTIGR